MKERKIMEEEWEFDYVKEKWVVPISVIIAILLVIYNYAITPISQWYVLLVLLPMGIDFTVQLLKRMRKKNECQQ